jgi:hypothetical protein
VAATLAACSSDGTATPVTTPATTAPAAGPTTQTATTSQYASAFNGTIKGIQKSWQQWQDDGCVLDDSAISCQLIEQTVGIEAMTLTTEIDTTTTVGAPGYVGDPPAEIAKLVANTGSSLSASRTTSRRVVIRW